MSVLALQLDKNFDLQLEPKADLQENESDEGNDDFNTSMETITKKKPPKLGRLRSPSFEGYFASQSGAYAWQSGNTKLKPNAEKFEEIQAHLEQMIGLLREIDVLRMAVRIESRYPTRKRYMTVISSDLDHSAIIGIDWTNDSGPTIGLVLPIWSTTVTLLDGDGGLSVSRTRTRNYFFKPVSVQTLWSARQVIDKATEQSNRFKYYEGVSTNGFLDYYRERLSSDRLCVEEWNEMDDLSSHAVEILTSLQQSRMQEDGPLREKISVKLREIMRKVDLDDVSCKQLRLLCEKDLGLNLSAYKQYIDQEVLVIMGQMDSATQMLDYLYLGSEWNASNLAELKEFGVGHILNITREVDNFFPQSFTYYNIRVLDVEETELLKHWDHTYRFIEKARQEGSKVLVHCRYGISRSASTVIAYLMKKKGWSMQEALDYVVKRRSIVQPNPSFQNQLIVYDGILNSSRNRYSSLFHQRTLKLSEEKRTGPDAEQRRKRFKSSRTASVETQGYENNMDSTDGADADDMNASYGDNDENKENIFAPNEVGENTKNAEDSVENAILEEASQITHPPPLVADMSICEEMEVEEIHQLRRQSTAHRARLMRAKTMRTGAVFFDEEDSSDCDSASNRANASSNEENSVLTDPDEDKLMEQVVMATQMKNELIRSVQKLQSDSSNDDVSLKIETDEYNIKPSLLRRMSHVSALLHFENLAKMKRRKSLTESQLQEIIEAEDEEKKLKPVSKNNVASISEIFRNRSRKHVLDYARRRTMNDDSMMDFDIRTAKNIHYIPADGVHAKSTSSLPLYTQKTPFIESEKESGNDADDNRENGHESDDEEIISIAIDRSKHPKNSTSLNRSSSLNTRRPSDKKLPIDFDNDSDRLSVEALDLDRSFQDESKFSSRIEVKVSELVDFHNRLIREKCISKMADECRPSPILDNNDLLSEDVVDEKSGEKSPKRSFRRTNLYRVKRVQSFPMMKIDDSFSDDRNDGNLSSLGSEESQSLPSSPEFSRRTENYRDVTKHTIMAYLTMGKHERPEKDVRSIVKKFEQQDFSMSGSSTKNTDCRAVLRDNSSNDPSSQSVA